MDDARWAIGAQEDVIGMDRLARSLLRLVARMAPASMVALHGAPGSGKAALSEGAVSLSWELLDNDTVTFAATAHQPS